MKLRNNSFWLGLLTAAVFLPAACNSNDDDSTVTNVDGDKYMQGSLAPDADDFYVRGTTCFLTADGLTYPDHTSISYRWSITTAATGSAVWGQSIYYTFPESRDVSTFTIALTASGVDYFSSSSTKSGTLIDSTFAETVAVTLPAGLEAQTFTFLDTRDQQTYRCAHIGDRQWMVQNMNWRGAGKPYKNQTGYGVIYGRLYSWNDAQTACPTGWHLPTNDDWAKLGQTLSGNAATTFAEHWTSSGSNAAANATVNGNRLWPYNPNNLKKNTHGWNALPAGKATGGNTFSEAGKAGYWWSADEYTAGQTACYRYILSTSDAFYFHYGDSGADGLYLSVRCVKQ